MKNLHIVGTDKLIFETGRAKYILTTLPDGTFLVERREEGLLVTDDDTRNIEHLLELI